MAIIVHKYGGSSVANLERITFVAQKVHQAKALGYQVVVVLSAMQGETDRLYNLGKKIVTQTDDSYIITGPVLREMDALIATGEMVSTALLAMHLNAKGCAAVSFNAFQAGIQTDSAHSKSRIQLIDAKKIQHHLAKDQVVVVAGFQGIDTDGHLTTLGRGGSDTTAVALSVALKAKECQIYTDVEGVYTADPRVIPCAKRIRCLSFEEMLEMSSLGSKVLQIRSVELACHYKMNLRVLSTFLPVGEDLAASTLIKDEDCEMEKVSVLSVVSNKDEAKIRLCGLSDRPSQAYQVVHLIAEKNIEIDMIVQNISQDNLTDLTFTVHRRDFDQAMGIVQANLKNLDAKAVVGDQQIVKVSLVGAGMRSHAGVASKMFYVLGKEGINIQMISTSEIKISVVVHAKYHELALRALHDAFIGSKE